MPVSALPARWLRTGLRTRSSCSAAKLKSGDVLDDSLAEPRKGENRARRDCSGRGKFAHPTPTERPQGSAAHLRTT